MSFILINVEHSLSWQTHFSLFSTECLQIIFTFFFFLLCYAASASNLFNLSP